MPAKLKSWFGPPRLDGDEELLMQVHLLHISLIFVSVYLLLVLLVYLLGAAMPSGVVLVDALLLLAMPLFRCWLHQGRVRLAAWGLLLAVFIASTLVIFAIGSVNFPATTTYVVIILLAGVVFGLNGVRLVGTAASLAVLGLLIYFNRQGPPGVVLEYLPVWFTYTVVFLVSGSLVHAAMQALRFALEASRAENARRRAAEDELELLNRDLEQRVVERTAQLSQAQDELRRANLALERAMRAKDEFLASMSHELRTPLTGILGLSEALELDTYGPLNSRQMKAIQMVQSSGRHLLALINDVLDLAKLEAGKLAIEPVPLDLHQLCLEALQLTRGMSHQKRQAVSFTIEPLKITLQADPRRLKQIIVNLLSNAIKFTAEGGSLGLQVHGDETQRLVFLCVWDHGIGIPEHELDRLFQPFQQINSSLSRGQAGSGLGLALVRDLVGSHGGSVAVQSTYGEGSSFTVMLPWIVPADTSRPDETPEAADAAVAEAVPGNTSLAAGSGPRVFIVDDNQANAEILCDYLQMLGMQVQVSSDARRFLEQAPLAVPDIVLMDIQMPEMDGLEAIRRLRVHPDPRLASVPVVALTALAMDTDRSQALAAGANEYLSKPFAMQDVAGLISSLAGAGQPADPDRRG
ncbi:MAG: ATP-binding protein [Chloroflexota bacterium]